MQQPDEQSNVPLRTAQPERRRRQRRSGARAQPLQQKEQQIRKDFENAYFERYAELDIHREMIKDSVRTEAYKEAIMHHQDFIKDKVVLDVGCGTGILSIFCARAGAKRVYAVEASSIAVQASSVVQDNNLSDVVMVLHGRIEDTEIDEKVDVIISEWMGYMLLYESMLGSVITARDRWLKPGGLILPSNAALYMVPITHTERYRESIDFWRDVYGINMSALLPLAKKHAFVKPSVETITFDNVLTWPHLVKDIDCYSITIPELESVTTEFKFSSMMKAPLHGFAFWFDVEFRGLDKIPSPMPISFQPSTSSVHNLPVDTNHPKVILSTTPEDPPTHWKQTLIYFNDPIELEEQQVIEGKVTLSQSQQNARFLDISIEYHTGGHSCVKQTVMSVMR